MVTFLIAAAMANLAIPIAAPATPALPDASPTIWVVNDDDTVIYLFGTFHALDGQSDWFNDEVQTAFAASDELVLETIVPAALTMPPEASGWAPFPSRHQARRLPVAPSASFLATTHVAISAGRTKGLSVEKGADQVLRRAAEAAGKPVEGLEKFEHQLGMFMRLPAPQTPSSPLQKLQAMQRQSMMMTFMQAAWNRGDQSVFTNVVEQLRRSSPDTYRMMFTDRNASWAGWIADRLGKPGTVFVAVGAGHLAGIDSVQAKLAQRGVRSERIN